MPGMTTNPNFTVSENRRIKRIFSDYLEAVTVANRIKELVDNHFKVYDGNGKYRDLKYSDMSSFFSVLTKVNGRTFCRKY